MHEVSGNSWSPNEPYIIALGEARGNNARESSPKGYIYIRYRG